MPANKVVSREEWQEARNALLEREKELTRRSDELAEERRALPWVAIEKDYSFETDAGTRTLAELFDGRSQLLVYHFMFGPPYTAGCPVCTSIGDGWDRAAPHLTARDTTFTLISRAPLDKLQAYRERMGWSMPWASSENSDFNYDFHATHTPEQLRPFLESGQIPPVVEHMAEACGTDVAGYVSEGPGMTVFALEDGTIYQTYSSSARGLEFMMAYYGALDRVPKGRNEDAPEHWLRRRDEY